MNLTELILTYQYCDQAIDREANQHMAKIAYKKYLLDSEESNKIEAKIQKLKDTRDNANDQIETLLLWS
jgi:hypothetical protein